MRYLITIAVILSFCLSANAEILVFKTTISGQQFYTATKVVEKKTENGYLVINADLSNTNNVTVSEAQHLHYEKKAGSSIQNTTILEAGEIEIILADYGNAKKMTLRYFDTDKGVYETAFGNTKLKDIGNGVMRYVPSSLSGHGVWKEPDFRTGSGAFKLMLDLKATQAANTKSKTVINIIDAYSQALEAKGYVAE